MFEILKNFLEIIEQKKLGIFSYFIIGFIIYFNIYGASFADDSIESFIDFKRNGWNGFEHSYDFSSLYYFHDFICIVFGKLFGECNYLWFLFLLFFHTTSSYFLFLFLKNLLSIIENSHFKSISFVSSVLFLVSAYNCENVFWIATYHYAFSFLYLILGLYFISQWQGEINFKRFLALFALFPLMLTMHEMVFLFPFAFGLTVMYFRKRIEVKNLILFMIPFGMIEGLALLATKCIKGSYIPHYGVEHIQNHQLYSFLYTLYQYIVKHVFFIHNFPFSIREKIYDVDSKTMVILFGVLVLILCVLFIKKKLKLSNYREIFFLMGLLLIFYFPVSNMYFMWHFPLQNDRLSYFFSPFLYGIVSVIGFKFLGKYARWILGGFILLHIFFLRINISKIQESIYFTEHVLKESYRPYLDQKPVILNLPFSRDGFYVYRKPHRLKSAMYYYYGKEIDFDYIASMPFHFNRDSVEIERVSDSSIKINLKAENSWFMNGIVGASDYENEDIIFDTDEWNSSAIIRFKKKKSNQPILYIHGEKGFVEWNK